MQLGARSSPCPCLRASRGKSVDGRFEEATKFHIPNVQARRPKRMPGRSPAAGHAHLRIDPLFERLDYERIIVPCPEVDGSESVRHGRLADQLGDIVLAVD